MKLATFTHDNSTRIGLVVDDHVVDLAAAAPDLPREMVAFLATGESGMDRARTAVDAKQRIPLAQVHLEMPMAFPPLIMHGGLNYPDTVARTHHKALEISGSIKIPTALVAPYDPIVKPVISNELDYEVELAFVIGKTAKSVSYVDAADYIAGYMIMNDAGGRDWLPPKRGRSGAIGKNFDRTSPVGPWIVTPDEVGDPHNLDFTTWVNGEVRQSGNTRNMINDCFEHLRLFSSAMTLLPGTVLTTGSSTGSAFDFDPPRYLQVGDVVRMEIEKLGVLENLVVAAD